MTDADLQQSQLQLLHPAHSLGSTELRPEEQPRKVSTGWHSKEATITAAAVVRAAHPTRRPRSARL